MSTKKWMTQLTKDFGRASADLTPPGNKTFKLASPSFNWATGVNGIPEGKATLLFGGENSGKSLLMQLIFAEIQRQDPEAICILFDTEYSHNSAWFKKLGGDPSRLLVRQTNDPLMIFDYIIGEMREMLQDGAPIRAIGIDSVKNIVYPKDMKDKTVDLTMGGGGASYLGPTLKRVLPVIREHNVTTILVQQVYEEMDPMKAMRNPYKLPDGRALKHFCDLMIQVDRLDTKAGTIESGENISGGKTQTGHKIRLKNRKNRVGSPYRVAEFTLDYNQGIVNTESETVELAKSLGIVCHPINDATGKPNLQMWQFSGYNPVRGEDNFKRWATSEPSILEEIIRACERVDDKAVHDRNVSLNEESQDSDFE
jgi:recombination protein RecA